MLRRKSLKAALKDQGKSTEIIEYEEEMTETFNVQRSTPIWELWEFLQREFPPLGLILHDDRAHDIRNPR